MNNELVKKVDILYKECEEIFTPHTEVTFDYADLKDENKVRFFAHISNFFMQKRQQEVIKNEKY